MRGSSTNRAWPPPSKPLAAMFTAAGLVIMVTALLGQTPAGRGAKGASGTAESLFFGKDTAKWLPKTQSMPTVADLEKIAQTLSSRARNIDPFGVPTFPTDEEIPGLVDPIRGTPRVTLNQALQTLKLNGVNLAQKAILIGGRNVYEGDVIELSFRDELFRALVVEVGSTEIEFHDTLRKEPGVIPHTMVRQLEFEPLQPANASLKSRMQPMEPFTSPKK
jgi:hypothetical protein